MQVGNRLRRRVENLGPIARTVVAVAREEQITLLAASLAYYLFLALVPLVLFTVIGLSLFGNDLLSQASTAASGTILPQGTPAPRQLLSQTSGRIRAAALGAVILAWSGLRMFGALDGAFAAVYDEREAVSFTGKLIDAILVLVTVTVAAAALAGISLGVAIVVEDGSLLRVVTPLLLFVTLVGTSLDVLRPSRGRRRLGPRDPPGSAVRRGHVDGGERDRPAVRHRVEQRRPLRGPSVVCCSS